MSSVIFRSKVKHLWWQLGKKKITNWGFQTWHTPTGGRVVLTPLAQPSDQFATMPAVAEAQPGPTRLRNSTFIGTITEMGCHQGGTGTAAGETRFGVLSLMFPQDGGSPTFQATNDRPQFFSLKVDCSGPFTVMVGRRTERWRGIVKRFIAWRDTDAGTLTERSPMYLHYQELSSWHWNMMCLIVCVVNLVIEPECLDVISD